MHRIRQRARDERGAAAVEFALILPILILLVFGIVQFAIVYNRTQGVHAAAREGARLGSLTQTTEQAVIDKVDASLNGGVLKPSDARTITVNGPGGNQPCNNAAPDQTVQVTVSTPYTIDIPLWPGSPLTKTIKTTAEFKCE